jgi:hypothetical protein
MGFVVFEETTGRAIKYYRKESVAKAQVTKNNRSIDNDGALRAALGIAPGVHYNHNRRWLYCSYAGYEGVLMGMKEPERKMWAFCRG